MSQQNKGSMSLCTSKAQIRIIRTWEQGQLLAEAPQIVPKRKTADFGGRHLYVLAFSKKIS